MICSEESIQNIVRGRKNQTRRLKKAGETRNRTTIFSVGNHIKWQAGRDYAVQPGRGKLGVWWQRKDCEIFYPDNHDERYQAFARGFKPLRIRILNIRQEDVRTISTEDVAAEGFDSSSEFLRVWCSMHDKQALARISPNLNYTMQLLIMARPDERYQAWVLDFEAVQL